MNSNGSIVKCLVVTPLKNGVGLIGDTFESLAMQSSITSGQTRIDYIIIDGNSTDGTKDEVEKLIRRHKKENFNVTFISSEDAGMYDALTKGFLSRVGREYDIYSYINAGDKYTTYAFEVNAQIYRKKMGSWWTGLIAYYDESGFLEATKLPYRYDAALLSRGAYGRFYLPYLQQESTFWTNALHARISWERLRHFKYAGDAFMWHCFSQTQEPVIIKCFLAGFRKHERQLSVVRKVDYDRELKSLSRNFGLLLIFKTIWFVFMHRMPDVIKERFNKKIIKTASLFGT